MSLKTDPNDLLHLLGSPGAAQPAKVVAKPVVPPADSPKLPPAPAKVAPAPQNAVPPELMQDLLGKPGEGTGLVIKVAEKPQRERKPPPPRYEPEYRPAPPPLGGGG